MKLAILGTGTIGRALAALFARGGHEVRIGSRDPRRAQSAAAATRARQGGTYADASLNADMLFYCSLFGHARAVLEAAGDLRGRILVDVSNPETETGHDLAIGHSTSGAEEIAAIASGTRVLKAFNYLYAELLKDDEALHRLNPTIFVAGDDDKAKDLFSSLARSCGLDAVDCGPLRNARYLEPVAMLMVQLVRTQGFPPDAIAMTLSGQRG